MPERTTPGMKAALSIGGSDSSGGAGIQADLKTWAAMSVFGCTALTTITAQNTKGVQKIHPLPTDVVEAQVEAVGSDIDCAAVKIGMVPSGEMAQSIASCVRRFSMQPLVLDPVMVAKSGDRLVDDSTAEAVARLLFPLAAVVTPNRFEAARMLGGQACENVAQGVAAAKQIAKQFKCHAVIVTGFAADGRGEEPPQSVDVFWTGEEIVELTGERRQTSNVHGAGCTFSAAIAGGLAQGHSLNDAVQQAKRLIGESIRQNIGIGGGKGPVNHLAWINVKK